MLLLEKGRNSFQPIFQLLLQLSISWMIATENVWILGDFSMSSYFIKEPQNMWIVRLESFGEGPKVIALQ